MRTARDQIVVAILGFLAASNSHGAQIDFTGIWDDVAEQTTIIRQSAREIEPARYRTLSADLPALDELLTDAPFEGSAAAKLRYHILSLPLPDGQFGRYRIVESPVMAPGLATRYPQIRTWAGQGIDDPAATIRIDRTPAGFHAMILSAEGTVFIDPYQRGEDRLYISYFRTDFVKRLDAPRLPDIVVDLPEPGTEGHARPGADAGLQSSEMSIAFEAGQKLRTYRLAVATTGEFTAFHGGTVAAGLAAVVTTINRVQGIYIRDLTMRVILVENNDRLIFTNPSSDPYDNDNGQVMLSQNQRTIDSTIGASNYDIGHVFSTGGGGYSGLGVICLNGRKAQSVTGLPKPIGDPFDINYVAHEMGHSFGANHTFNSTASNCSKNRYALTAYEPGSGSTIMGYAGICGSAADLQHDSDDYFHGSSIAEIVRYTNVGAGNSCAVKSDTGNSAPVVNAGPSFTIPVRTPFILTGSATDANGDALTYTWEEIDLGTASPPEIDSGNRPILRSFPPTPSASRTLPRLFDILSNANSPTDIGELLPTTARQLKLRLTVRDNRVSGGGVNSAFVIITSTPSAGPFAVTAPNTEVNWQRGSQQNVTWDVAKTAMAPISCLSVNILLSTDGGFTYPHVLASETENDGSEIVVLPSKKTKSGRVRVECKNNIFFDVSNVDFTIGR